MRRFLALMVLAAALRVAVNDVTSFSPADESLYRNYARFIASTGWWQYEKVIRFHIEDPNNWLSPSPLRYGYFALAGLACSVASSCEYETLAWLATLAGIASVALVYAIGRRLLDERGALVACALSVTSPIHLALGRRALQDEVFTASVLLALWAVLWAGDPALGRARSAWRHVAAVCALAFALTVKESFAFYYAAILAAYAMTRRGSLAAADVALVVAPPLLYVVGFWFSGGTLADMRALFTLASRALESPYVREFQGGPWHKPVIELCVLAPVACALCGAGLALVSWRASEDAGPRTAAAFVLASLLVFAFVTKNVRFIAPTDSMVHLLAAWALVAHPSASRRWVVPLVVAASAGVELWLFRAVFETANVYDPNLARVLEALGAIPPLPP